MRSRAGLCRAGLALCVLLPHPDAAAREPAPGAPRSWSEEKCLRYARDWREALARQGRDGLSESFLERHEAFVSGGCQGPRDVCPRSERDFAIANVLTIRAMNAGMASTFLPFACPR